MSDYLIDPNNKQLSNIKSMFIDFLVDGMDTDTLRQFATEKLEEEYETYGKLELFNTIESLFGERQLNEIINNGLVNQDD